MACFPLPSYLLLSGALFLCCLGRLGEIIAVSLPVPRCSPSMGAWRMHPTSCVDTAPCRPNPTNAVSLQKYFILSPLLKSPRGVWTAGWSRASVHHPGAILGCLCSSPRDEPVPASLGGGTVPYLLAEHPHQAWGKVHGMGELLAHLAKPGSASLKC